MTDEDLKKIEGRTADILSHDFDRPEPGAVLPKEFADALLTYAYAAAITDIPRLIAEVRRLQLVCASLAEAAEAEGIPKFGALIRRLAKGDLNIDPRGGQA